jgi:O-antigen ligase
VTSSISSTGLRRHIGPTLLAVLVLAAAFLAGGFYESTYSLLAAGVWLGIAVAAAVRPPPRPSPAFWALAALAAWTALSALWGPAGPALRVVPLAALYAGALYAAEWVAPDPLLRAVWAACVIVSAAALAGWIAGVGDRDRLDWPVTYSNGLGLHAVTGVLLAFRASDKVSLAGGALCGLTAVFTFSRSALLAGAAALVVYLAARGRIPRAVALAGAAAALVAAVFLGQPLAARFAAPAPDEGDARRLLDLTGHGRAQLWDVARDAWLDAPALGPGAGTYARSFIAETGDLTGPANAHSLYLETLAELGLVGLALILAFLVLGFSGHRRSALAASVLVAWGLHAAVDWTWQLPAATLPAVLAAGVLTRREAQLGRSAAAGLAAAALIVGIASGLHGVGAAVVETGPDSRDEARLAGRLLPFDARPWADVDRTRACEIDPDEPVLTRGEGCASRR